MFHLSAPFFRAFVAAWRWAFGVDTACKVGEVAPPDALFDTDEGGLVVVPGLVAGAGHGNSPRFCNFFLHSMRL